jgi:hypothetical protein
MALPVSIGDALMLSKIAFSIGQAFTSGRKSAPAEFLEVQNLLYSLSKALELLARDVPDETQIGAKGSSQQPEAVDSILSHIITNCRITLVHLETLVSRYTELDQANPASGVRKWKDELRKNWKKLRWTTEGEGLEKLKVTLTAHINGLNLAVSAINQ